MPRAGAELVDVGAEADPLAQVPDAGVLAGELLRARPELLELVGQGPDQVRGERVLARAQGMVHVLGVARGARADLGEVRAYVLAQPVDHPVHGLPRLPLDAVDLGLELIEAVARVVADRHPVQDLQHLRRGWQHEAQLHAPVVEERQADPHGPRDGAVLALGPAQGRDCLGELPGPRLQPIP